MTKEYEIIACGSIKELEDMVNQYIRSGYKPVGGVAIYLDFLLQAVYKEA